MRPVFSAKEHTEAVRAAKAYAGRHVRVLAPIVVGLVAVQLVALALPLPLLWSFVVATVVAGGLTVMAMVVDAAGGGVLR